LLDISYQYYKLGDSINFRRTNREARNLSQNLNDSSAVALTYWNLAGFYHSRNVEDSAYYSFHKAQKIYASLGNQYLSARVLLNMAIIQKNIQDYTGSEATTIQAISLLEPLKKPKHLYRAYNNLGIIHKELEEYDKSFSYYKIAEEYLKKADEENLLPGLWNNIGVMHKKNGQYDEAARYFDKALVFDEQLSQTDSELYAMLLDNQAHNQFKSGDIQGILPQYRKALAIRKEHKIIPGIIVNRLHLAEYFLQATDTTAAVQNAIHAKELSDQTLNAKYLLASVLFLSKATSDSSLLYAQKYIHINDSLQKRERATRNKFARIRYETAGYIAKTERLRERVKRISLIGIAGGIILILLVVIQRQRSKNKELVLIQEKNKKFEEGKEKEKHRISRELHDGVLAKLFGVTMSLDVLNNIDDARAKRKRAEGIEEIRSISEEIRLLSHELSETSLTAVDYKMLLEDFIEQQNQKETRFSLKIDPAIVWESIGDDIKVNLYRIMQEGVQNIHKHAKATKTLISFKINKGKLALIIKDNGRGFAPNNAKNGIGLKNIQNRVESLGGELEITSEDSKGSQLKISISIS